MSSLFAIFGNPVSHSKSPLMHNATFKALDIDSCYARYQLTDGERLREKFLSLRLTGANITVPHKEHAYRACDYLDEFAQKVGSVNTIVKRDGKLYGYNTDAPGFLRAISEFEDIKRVLFIGAGGTAQSTSVVLRDAGYDVTIINRTPARLERYISDGFVCYSFDELLGMDMHQIERFDLVVNMTSAGLEDDSLPAPMEILNEFLPHSKACVDVIYGKQTPFLRLAKEQNKETKDGSDMLLYQGIIAFEHFTNYSHSFKQILPHMRRVFDLD